MDKIKITFAPGAFKNFEGTQEELDSLVKEIQDLFGNLTLEEIVSQSQAIDIGSMIEDIDPETVAQLLATVSDNKVTLN